MMIPFIIKNCVNHVVYNIINTVKNVHKKSVHNVKGIYYHLIVTVNKNIITNLINVKPVH